jgi:GTPase involved in cell partitioning and DNA repair
MAQRLKRWESPRNEGRNDKGKGGSARQRQLKKRTQMLRNKLKEQSKDNNGNNGNGRDKKGENHDSLLFFVPMLNQNPRLLREVGDFLAR